MRLGVLATHPIQYHAPLYRALTDELDLSVYFAHQQTAAGQADAGFGVPFEWDVPLLDGYPHTFLRNRAARPDVSAPFGCHTPDIADLIARERFDAFLVNGWYNRSFWQAIRACWRTGTPLLVRGDSQLRTPRSLAKRLAKEAAYRAFIPRFDGYLVVGQRAREYYLHYGARPERMHFVPHFVDNAFFRERSEGATGAASGQTGRTPTTRLVLLFAGKFIPEKRPTDLVRAADTAPPAGPRCPDRCSWGQVGSSERDPRPRSSGRASRPTSRASGTRRSCPPTTPPPTSWRSRR